MFDIKTGHDFCRYRNSIQVIYFQINDCEHCTKLIFGLLLEFNDSIKEGDGERLLDVYKVALVLYKEYGKANMHMKFFCFL